MSEPTIGLTFQDMIIRVAEYLGVADYSGGVGGGGGNGVAAVPVDAHDLDLCKRLVNDGYRKFVNANPRWQFLTPLITLTFAPQVTGTATSNGTTTTLTDSTRTEAAGSFVGQTILFTGGTGAGQFAIISAFSAGKQFTFGAVTTAPDTTTTYSVAPSQCVNGDNSRYYLPDGFYGSLIVPWTPPAGTGRPNVSVVNEEIIRQMYAGASSSGNPVYCGFRPITATVTTSGKRWEAIFWPAPSAAYTITARARIYPDKLVSLTDRPVSGFAFDEVVLAAALSEAERQRNDQVGIHAAQYTQTLQAALLIDREAAPKRLGGYGDRSDDTRLPMRPYGFKGVDTYNNVPV